MFVGVFSVVPVLSNHERLLLLFAGNRKTLPRQGRERVLARGATLFRSIGKLILTARANGHSRGSCTDTPVSCFVPDSQATFGTAAPRKIRSLLIFLLSRSAPCLLLLLIVVFAVLLALV